MSKIEEVRNQKHTIPWLNLPWYKVYDMISALPASVAPFHLKAILRNVARHTNRNPEHPKYGRAWLEQVEIAAELSCSEKTVKRAFAEAREAGLIGVDRVRHGKKPSDQHNEYWLEWDAIQSRVEETLDAAPSVTSDDRGTGDKNAAIKGQLVHEQGTEEDGTGDKTEGIKGQIDPIGLDLGFKGGFKTGNNNEDTSRSCPRASHLPPTCKTKTETRTAGEVSPATPQEPLSDDPRRAAAQSRTQPSNAGDRIPAEIHEIVTEYLGASESEVALVHEACLHSGLQQLNLGTFLSWVRDHKYWHKRVYENEHGDSAAKALVFAMKSESERSILTQYEEWLDRQQGGPEPTRAVAPDGYIRVHCPSCGTRNKIKASIDPRRVHCGKCKAMFAKEAA